MLQSRTARSAKPARLHSEAGVTLVEMMVVIIIIGLISAIVAINVLPSQDKARVQKAAADIATLEQAIELFRLETGRLPTTDEGLTVLAAAPAAGSAAGATRREPYIRNLPNDPWNHGYQYVTPGEHGPYDLYSLGADGKPGGKDLDADVGNWK